LTVVDSKDALLADEPAPAAAALLAGAAGLLLCAAGLLELAELPQAATVKAIVASPATPHIFRIRMNFPFTMQAPTRDHVRLRPSVHQDAWACSGNQLGRAAAQAT
jgi:hypothetical protein